MKKILCSVVGVILGLVMFAQSADAQSRRGSGSYPRVVIGPFDLGDERIFWSGLIAGGAMTGTYFAIEGKRALKIPGDGKFSTGAFLLTSAGCATLAPMLASAIVWHTEQRHLTSRDGLIVDAAYERHPEWR
jgi:hypothetical protein